MKGLVAPLCGRRVSKAEIIVAVIMLVLLGTCYVAILESMRLGGSEESGGIWFSKRGVFFWLPFKTI